MDADIKILLGSIEPHHFMGYSGGVKTAVIGLASRETIRRNHAMLTSPLATTGSFAANPCRIDVEEMGDMAGIDLCLNVVLDTDKNIRAAFFGNPREVVKQGIDFSKIISQVSVGNYYDLVIVSCGGYPKDINLYQAQKAVSNAAMITADGGEVILMAECREGHGSDPYYDFMQGLNSYEEVIDKFNHDGFKIGPHKAFLIARQLKRIQISVVSNMSDQLTRKLLLTPLTRDQVIKKIQAASMRGQKVAFLPFGVSTVPRLEE
jgi:nickel-dependent lactate racemase